MASTVDNDIRIVIGSWGSYNECNERALGSKWLTLADYDDWEQIEDELKKEGFELDGIDEELFVQDVDNLDSDSINWDLVHPQRLFDVLFEADVLCDEYKRRVMDAYLEVHSFREFECLVDRYGSKWDMDIILWSGFDWEDYGKEMYNMLGYEIPDDLLYYFDFKEYGESFKYDSDIAEYSGGLIEIR